jgi:hypothetical protein
VGNTKLVNQVHNYILNDRQWPRIRRIAFARFARKRDGKSMHSFWDAVLKANGVFFDAKGQPTQRISSSTSFSLKQVEKHEQREKAKVTLAEVQ